MIVTHEFILAGMSGNGGWSRAQLELLGIQWPPVQGWKWRAIGTVIPDSDADLFLALKGKKKAEIKRQMREGTLTLFNMQQLEGAIVR